ncbi:MAG: hypothetical protein AABY22_09125 [Nanoarchaeota archaeon]
MITLEESEFLLQIAGSMKEQERLLESSYNSRDYEKMKRNKELILKIQTKINEILAIRK